MELKIRTYQGGSELSICGRASTCAPDLGRDIVQFLAVLVCHDGAGGGASVGCNYYTARIETSNDRGTGGGCLREGDAAGMERKVAVVVGEVEAWHLCYSYLMWCSVVFQGACFGVDVLER